MKDFQNSKKLLNSVLASLQGESLSEARYHVRAALQKLNEVEKKAQRKAQQQTQNAHQTWHELLTTNVSNPYTPKRTLDIINRMIEEEKNKMKPPEHNELGDADIFLG